jgi:hypothetical protein
MKTIALANRIALASLLVSGFAHADDDDLSLDDLPTVVRTTVEREVGSGTIDDIEWESGPSGDYYEVEFAQGTEEWELRIAEDGRLLAKRPD